MFRPLLIVIVTLATAGIGVSVAARIISGAPEAFTFGSLLALPFAVVSFLALFSATAIESKWIPAVWRFGLAWLVLTAVFGTAWLLGVSAYGMAYSHAQPSLTWSDGDTRFLAFFNLSYVALATTFIVMLRLRVRATLQSSRSDLTDHP